LCNQLEIGSMSDDLTDDIYEAAFVPEKWSTVLDAIGTRAGSASGAMLSIAPDAPPRWRATPVVEDTLRDYVESGQWLQCQRPVKVLAMRYPGFLRDEDYLTSVQIAQDPARKVRETVNLGGQAATLVAMPGGEMVGFTFERWIENGTHDANDIAFLDGMRPHLARAGMIAARLGLERAKTMVTALATIGFPAAVVTGRARVIAVNELLEAVPAVFLSAASGRFTVAHATADALIAEAIDAIAAGRSDHVQSVPLPAQDGEAAYVIHVAPLRGAARDIFSGATALVLATEVGLSQGVPSPDLLRGLFDLTPKEAMVAIRLASGQSLKEAAEAANMQFSTARSHLESVFRKTGTNQQSQLVALLKSTQPLGNAE
jgi:DNA-binding CsgD family transcriptional regulator